MNGGITAVLKVLRYLLQHLISGPIRSFPHRCTCHQVHPIRPPPSPHLGTARYCSHFPFATATT
ncbi:hypothetical protein GQ44DRAFT_717244 [Phaeosphaeriaceae sp. PMI808]|nr:hypothetical protein GQ44DRAFT_717244 [Phaeosphaeriaceae sp. PMI808]